MSARGADLPGLHWFSVDCGVVDAEEFFFVEDHFLSCDAYEGVFDGQFDGIYGAGFLAHATEDAA